ncbi:hypothetical protein K443DRAFT_14345 [Laccaria amethystina LaAM-08-1]|uniref:Unplaced genomic scaffold K443scaffold_464, whole genome shotgun sequence n=1 Tax=Laccaria amethystina LaAM-08-1 TaxID=1095629 RepID=A0A0C9WTE5_9AGAR|nr:hypothetical protein K443DRAFT_14345 [Laccaria amethystina LaAM-08-1]
MLRGSSAGRFQVPISSSLHLGREVGENVHSGNTPPTSQSQLPLDCLSSAAEPDYLIDPSATFLDYVDHWEGLSDTTFSWWPRFSAL